MRSNQRVDWSADVIKSQSFLAGRFAVRADQVTNATRAPGNRCAGPHSADLAGLAAFTGSHLIGTSLQVVSSARLCLDVGEVRSLL